jgi:hypothetical protein
MKIKSIVGFLMIGGSLCLSAFKDDEPTKSVVSFEISEVSLKESDGTLESFHPLLVDDATGTEIEVKIVFDKPLAQKAVIEYSVGGTATRNSTSNPVGDFEIDGNGENITIEKGATEAIITIMVYEDYDFEVEEEDDDGYIETIEITLESVTSGPVKIGEDKTYTLTLYEDDTVIFLNWDGDASDAVPGDVDMDLLLWIDGVISGRSDSQGNVPEGIAIPAGFPDEDYGMSYTYYSGKSDDLDFAVEIQNLGGTLNVTDQELFFTGNHTLANINPYDPATPDVEIVQTMVKNEYNYTNISGIADVLEGSRVGRSTRSLKERLKGVTISTLQNRDGFNRD